MHRKTWRTYIVLCFFTVYYIRLIYACIYRKSRKQVNLEEYWVGEKKVGGWGLPDFFKTHNSTEDIGPISDVGFNA